MKKNDIKLFKKPDILVFLFVVFLAAALLIFGIKDSNGARLCISVGESESFYSLDKDLTLQLENEGISLTVTVKDGQVFVTESECDDKICVNSGKISKAGQIIVCAPAKISIKILSSSGGDLDAVTS